MTTTPDTAWSPGWTTQGLPVLQDQRTENTSQRNFVETSENILPSQGFTSRHCRFHNNGTFGNTQTIIKGKKHVIYHMEGESRQ